jgi:ketosteroid isomerase-like protein
MRKSWGPLAAALSTLSVLSGCHSDRPEDQVRKAFETCRAGVESGDVAEAISSLDPEFRGPDGMDKATAGLFLLGTLRQEKIGVTVVRNEIAVQRGEAFQEVDLLLTGRSGGLLPQDVSRRRFRLRWRKARGGWKLMELQSLDGR